MKTKKDSPMKIKKAATKAKKGSKTWKQFPSTMNKIYYQYAIPSYACFDGIYTIYH